MKKIFLILLLSPLLLLCNMAKPWMDGSQHSVLYGSDNISVKKEIIDIFISKDSAEDIYSANFKIRYHIFSEQNQTVPLLFIAVNLSTIQDVKVNNSLAVVEKLDIEKNNYSFIKKNQNGIFVKYNNASDIQINPDFLIYFMANLKKGDNVIEVNYHANMEYNTYGFVKDYKLKYSLYPSKFWKSFGPIEVNLILDNKTEFKESNLGGGKIVKQNLRWNITPQNREFIEISLSDKPSLFSKFLLLLEPLGLAVFALVILFFIHLKILRKIRKMYILILGIIFVPVLFYVTYFLSFDLIDFSLGKNYTKHGYTFFFVLTYPFLLVLYWVLMYQIFKRKIMKS